MAESILQIPTLDECRAAVKADFATRLGNDLRPEIRHSVVGVLQEVTALREYNLLLLLQRAVDASFLSTAAGEQLTRLAAVFGEQRKQRTPSIGRIILYLPTIAANTRGTVTSPQNNPMNLEATIGGRVRRFTWSGSSAIYPAELLDRNRTGSAIALRNAQSVDLGSESNISANERGTAVTASNYDILGQTTGLTIDGRIDTSFTGGSDLEIDETLRERLLSVIRTPIAGGTEAEWRNWTLQFSGVSKAFVRRVGPSQIQIFPVFSANVNGVPSTQNLTDLRTHLNQFRPAATELFLRTFTPKIVNIEARISPFNTTTQSAAVTAIEDTARVFGALGQNFPLYHINNALATAEGIGPFQLVSPTADIEVGENELVVFNATVTELQT